MGWELELMVFFFIRCRYKAEVDFDGRELTRVYLDKLDVAKMLEVKL